MTVFNSGDQSGNIELSTDGLSVSVNTNAAGGVRATTSKAAGKFYVEFVWDVVAGVNLASSGFMKSTGTLANSAAGDTANPIVRESGNVRINGINAGFLGAAPAAGDTIGAAIDFDNEKVWFRINGGNWDNDGSANPATNTNGFSTSGIGALFPIIAMDRTGVQITANFTGGFNFAAPSGFTAWDGETPSSTASDEAASDALASDELASDERAAEEASSDKPARDAASSDAAVEAASSDALLSERVSSDVLAAEEASSDKLAHDAFSSDHHEQISSDNLASNELLSEQNSSEFQSDIAALPAPPIQTVVTLSS